MALQDPDIQPSGSYPWFLLGGPGIDPRMWILSDGCPPIFASCSKNEKEKEMALQTGQLLSNHF